MNSGEEDSGVGLTMYEDAREDDKVHDGRDDRSKTMGSLVVWQDAKGDLDVEDG